MLKMGCAKADVTPDFPVYQQGYGFRNRKTAAVADRLETGVIALEQDGQRMLLITADMVGITVEECGRISGRIETDFGIGARELIVSCSHTHFAPAFSAYVVAVPGGELAPDIYPGDERYFEFWYAQTRDAVRRALDDLEEVSLESVAIPVSGISFNRRTVRKSDGMVKTNYVLPEDLDAYHFSPVDPEFLVWRFMRGNEVKAMLGRFSCHPVTGDKAPYEISADYPGVLKQVIAGEYGCPGFFLLGTAGDAVPMKRGLRARKYIGEILGRMIHMNELRFRPEPEFRLAVKSFTVPGILKRVMESGDPEARWRKARETARDLRADDFDAYLKFRDEACGYLVTRRFGKKEFDIPIRLVRFGGRVLVCLPFEVLTDIGSELRAACPEAVIISVAGGYEGYLGLEADFKKGGYETDIGADFLPDTGDRILAACIDAVREFSR